jgi:16S rRNA (adenine1518-N6/adenine1519-N6)-dimethyltransferase
MTVLPLTDPDRFPEGPGAARAVTRWDVTLIPPAPQPVADPKMPALPAVRQLQVVVVPEKELLEPDVEPDKLAAGGVVGPFGLLPPQLDRNDPSATATLRPRATCNNLACNFKMGSSEANGRASLARQLSDRARETDSVLRERESRIELGPLRKPNRRLQPYMSPARKRFGQHFLEAAWVEKVMAAIVPQADETFLEIGPGRGALTIPLAARAKHVVACEIDRDLVSDLRRSSGSNVTIVEGDFLELSAERIRQELASANSGARFRVVGNLPYNIASPILFRLVELFDSGVPLVDATVMLQREVADRLTAPPGTKEYGVLSVLIGYAAKVERLLALPPGAFRPAPEVRSAVVRLRFHDPEPPARDRRLFETMVQAIFTRRRKTLANALDAFPPSAALAPAKALTEAGLDGRKRPENMTIAELVRLSDAFSDADHQKNAKPRKRNIGES